MAPPKTVCTSCSTRSNSFFSFSSAEGAWLAFSSGRSQLPLPSRAAACFSAAAAVLCAFLLVEWQIPMTRIDNLVGFTRPEFARIEKIFKKNFHDGWEREGAALAVYHKGELVIDLQGGYADRAANRLWTDKTRTVVFSATKAMGALCVAMLVDRGHLSYDDRVVEYWPEFAQHGKENITIGCVMNHKAGLAAFDEPISREAATNPEKMAKIIERQKPNWPPGTKSGYHALTFGWLVDQLVRRADPQHRSVGVFFREEIAERHGIDFHIGLPPSEEHTVSRISLPSFKHVLREIMHDPRVLLVLGIIDLQPPGTVGRKVRGNPAWYKLDHNAVSFNDPDFHAMEQAAALGIGKARDMARLFSLFLHGEIVSKTMLSLFRYPADGTTGMDATVLLPLPKGHGFVFERHPLGGDRWLFGHSGYGGSTIMMDADEDLVIAYVTNGLKTGMGELTGTYRRLRNGIFECIEEAKNAKRK